MSRNIWHDLRYTVRKLRRNPGFALVAVATLALGIGASTAIFSVVDAALLRALPFAEPDRLTVILGVAGPDRDVRGGSWPEVRDWKTLSRSFSDVSIYDETTLNLSGMGAAEMLEAEIVSPGYFRLLGTSPQLGRDLLPEDDVPGVTAAVVISHGLWQGRFGGARDVLGRTVILDDRQGVVVGVMPEGFQGLSFDTQIWTTLLPFEPEAANDRGGRWLAAIGRLRQGVSD
ncbi:MAG: ABC transporter permease, partial [Planctomycetaceae bacterium]